MSKKELDMRTRKRIGRIVAERYKTARKKEKSVILDEFVKICGYSRKYAGWLLRQLGKKVIRWEKGKKYVIIGEIRSQKGIRKRPLKYDEKVKETLKKIWYILDMPCGKRMSCYIGEIVEFLDQKGILKVKREVKEKLKEISSSTIDRILKEEREKLRIKKKRSFTKPGSLLKSQIPIKTFSEWDETVPGFIEIDLVEHIRQNTWRIRRALWRSGGVARGIYAQTLDATSAKHRVGFANALWRRYIDWMDRNDMCRE